MKRIDVKKGSVALVVVAVLLGFGGSAMAQKVYYVGSLNTADQFMSSFDGFRARMAELGYREGVKIRYEVFNSKGDPQVLKSHAQTLVQNGVDLIVTSSTTATIAAAKATEGSQIPVVFLSAGNPQKLVKDFKSSARNLAGISSASLELIGKRLELIKELVPAAKRVAVPMDLKGSNYTGIISEAREAATKLQFSLWEVGLSGPPDLLKTSLTITRASTDAIFAPPDALVTEGISVFVNQAIREKLPLITSLLGNVKKGCLATYAADYVALGKQGAILVDKIFSGTKPSDLPIELPYKLNLVINLKTAKAIELKIPKDILLRADQVIE